MEELRLGPAVPNAHPPENRQTSTARAATVLGDGLDAFRWLDWLARLWSTQPWDPVTWVCTSRAFKWALEHVGEGGRHREIWARLAAHEDGVNGLLGGAEGVVVSRGIDKGRTLMEREARESGEVRPAGEIRGVCTRVEAVCEGDEKRKVGAVS